MAGDLNATLVPATGALLEEILDETYPLWGEGLSRAASGRYNRAQLKTAWGSAHLRRVALVSPDGGLLSTAKRYDLHARLHGRRVRALGIGAVFTPARLRGRRLALALLERLLETARQEGFGLALLFSAIGSDYYRRVGFEAVPLEQLSLDVHPARGAPAVLVRAGTDRDSRFLADMHEARAQASRWPFALERNEEFITFAIARRRLLAGLGPPGLRELEFFVVDEADRPAAYAVLLNTRGSRMLCECGDRDPSGARVGALLQSLRARTPHERPSFIRAWLPPGFHPPQIDIVRVERPSVTLMLAPVQPGASIPRLEVQDVMYWLGDVV